MIRATVLFILLLLITGCEKEYSTLYTLKYSDVWEILVDGEVVFSSTSHDDSTMWSLYQFHHLSQTTAFELLMVDTTSIRVPLIFHDLLPGLDPASGNYYRMAGTNNFTRMYKYSKYFKL